MDLDGDSRISKDEFILALRPYEPYSKILKKAQDNIKNKFFENIINNGENYLNY
jgi:uncharacterized protein YjgD (DUF1641 family)